jgi:peptidoglycan/LPS O-acetylase OafA/YrhL
VSAPRVLGHRPALDGLRGLAVLLVVFHHAAFGHLPGGFLGVDVFFALSGFLITTLLLEEWSRRGDVSLRGFYARRVRRLVPALLVLLLLGCVLETSFEDMHGEVPYGVGALGALLYVNNWLMVWDGAALRTLAPTWSLAVEEQFYLLWPLALLVMLRRRIRPAALLCVTGGVTLVSLVYTAVVARINPDYNIYVESVPRAGELALGATLAVLWREGWVPAPLRSRVAGLLALATLGVLGVEVQMREADWLYTWDALFLGALCAGVLLVTCLERPDCLLGRLFRLRFLRHVGRISYGIYLYNLPLVFLLDPRRTGIPEFPSLLLRLAAVYAAAALSWWLVESRFVRRGRPGPVVRDGQQPARVPVGAATAGR